MHHGHDDGQRGGRKLGSTSRGTRSGRHARTRGSTWRLLADHDSAGVRLPLRCLVSPRAGTDMSTAISVLLVDDHAVVRAGYRHLLARDPRIEVVGEIGRAHV